MKRLWIGCGVLALLLAVGITVSTAFCRIHGPVEDLLSEASRQAQAGDFAGARAKAGAAKEKWKTWQPFTAAFIDHGPMDEIDSLFAQLDTAQAQTLGGLCAQLAELIHALTDTHLLYWWTVL